MEIIKINIDSKFPISMLAQIEKINSKSEFSPIWQSIGWNIMLNKTGYIKFGTFIGILEGTDLVNFAIIETRSLGMGMLGNFIIGGPNEDEFIEILSEEIINEGKEKNVVFTQIESLVENNFPNFKVGSYKKFIERCTAIINLNEGKEKILSNMKQKGRYNIKVAEKSEIKVEKSDYSDQNLDKFYNLLNETRQRDSFNINSKEYFNVLLEYLYSNGLGGLYFASKAKDLISAGIFVHYLNTTYYYYGASTSDNEKRKYMAAYLLQWKLIEESIEKGMKNFDFLGISCPGCKSVKLAGVTDFKLKLTPNTKTWPEAKIFIYSKPKYLLLKGKNLIKKIIKR